MCTVQDNRTSDWSPRQAPGTEVLDVRSPAREPSCPLQMTSWPHQTPCRWQGGGLLQAACRWHMIPLQLTACRESPHLPIFLLQKTFPAEDPREFPAEADFGPLAIFETRSLSTSLKKCPPGPKVYWIYWCFQPTTASTALLEHCIASF